MEIFEEKMEILDLDLDLKIVWILDPEKKIQIQKKSRMAKKCLDLDSGSRKNPGLDPDPDRSLFHIKQKIARKRIAKKTCIYIQKQSIYANKKIREKIQRERTICERDNPRMVISRTICENLKFSRIVLSQFSISRNLTFAKKIFAFFPKI